MGRLSVNLCGEELDNPVIPASGTFGYGYEFAELYDINCLGTFSFKGTTKEPRFGNPTPRIAECTAGMINAVGLQNPGVDKVISEELPKLKKCFNKKVMANVSGFSVDEYAYTCEKLDSQEQVGWLEVNVSCPNVHGGGMSFGTDPKAAAQVTKAVKAVTKKPVIIKLSPNVTDIVSIAKACEDAGADGISLINTLLGMRIDLRTKKARDSEHDGRLLRKRDIPRGAEDGLSGLVDGQYPGSRHGRRIVRRGCYRDDARRSDGGRNRRSKPR